MAMPALFDEISALRAAMTAAALLTAACSTPTAIPDGSVSLWRMDCGRFDIADLEGRGPVVMPVSCYLVRDGEDYVMFDAGLPAALIGAPDRQRSQTVSLDRALAAQFAELGIDPAAVRTLVVSHYHGDHHGQAGLFTSATLVIGEGDLPSYEKARDGGGIAPWIDGTRPRRTIAKDEVLTSGGNVVALATPGHTPGHLSLLVRLGGRSYILTGDLVHQRGQLAGAEPSGNHLDKDRGKAEIERIKAIAAREHATIIVGHDSQDIGLLPAFPSAASSRGRE